MAKAKTISKSTHCHNFNPGIGSDLSLTNLSEVQFFELIPQSG